MAFFAALFFKGLFMFACRDNGSDGSLKIFTDPAVTPFLPGTAVVGGKSSRRQKAEVAALPVSQKYRVRPDFPGCNTRGKTET